MSGAPSSGFDPSPWIAANAALAARIGAGRPRGFGLMGMVSDMSAAPHPGRTITGDRDEERRRGLARIAGRGGRQEPGKSLPLAVVTGGPAGDAAISGFASLGGAGAAPVSTAALLARGYQPAVVKVISYAHGVTRATASARYIERDEVELETHDGLRLPDRRAVAEEIRAWSSSFEKRRPSQDVVAVRVQLSGLRDTAEDRERLGVAVAAAFDGHRHAVRIDAQPSGHIEARVVVVMARTITPDEKAADRVAQADDVKRPARPPRIRVIEQRMGSTEDAPMRKVFDARTEAAVKARIETMTGYPQHGISIEPATPGHGRDALGQRLSTLVSKVPARDHLGNPIRDAKDIQEVTRDWSRHLRSQTPRDTMHVVVSAKAGTDVKMFTNAVRAFLYQQFADHKFMFGVHTDKAEAGHIHAHAIVAVRSESGTKLHPGPNDLAQWRMNYAAHAREHGLEVVATRAVEQASSRSYGPKDKSIVDVAATPRPERKEQDRAYASDPRNSNLIRNAQERIETARANPIRIPMTERERASVMESLERWQSEVKATTENDLARHMLHRLTTAHQAGSILKDLRQAAAPENREAQPHKNNANETPAPAMSHQSKSAADMLLDLRVLNQKAADVAALLSDGTRAKFIERTRTYLETIAARIDQQRAEEARATSQERQSMAPIVEKVEQIVRAEVREAQQAAKVAGPAVEAGQKSKRGPLSEKVSRAFIERTPSLVREVERQVTTENSEVQAAIETARSIPTGPTITDQSVPVGKNDRVVEIRRKQAEMLEKLSKERAQTKERGHEVGE